MYVLRGLRTVRMDPHILFSTMDYPDVDSSRLQLEVGGWAPLLLAWLTYRALTTRLPIHGCHIT